jgi:hypothetical protein
MLGVVVFGLGVVWAWCGVTPKPWLGRLMIFEFGGCFIVAVWSRGFVYFGYFCCVVRGVWG